MFTLHINMALSNSSAHRVHIYEPAAGWGGGGLAQPTAQLCGMLSTGMESPRVPEQVRQQQGGCSLNRKQLYLFNCVTEPFPASPAEQLL